MVQSLCLPTMQRHSTHCPGANQTEEGWRWGRCWAAGAQQLAGADMYARGHAWASQAAQMVFADLAASEEVLALLWVAGLGSSWGLI